MSGERLPNESPRISIVVPSYNQGAFIRETLQSLVDQQYSNLEVIIQDAGSTDGAVEIAREYVDKYPGVFRLTVEKDRGHANAVNLGFAKSTGEILGYLNTDDTLYPGILHSIARQIDPEKDRFIVVGRCLFTGEGASYVGREHPAEYHGHFDMLAVWRRGRSIIPQPSTFWHRKVWETCGPFDERYNHGLDYLQWCRFSRRFDFHIVDELWSTYRMHPASVSSNKTEDEWLDIMINYSRMNWGPWWRPLRWRCELSYFWHDRRRADRARQHGREAAQALADGRYGTMILEGIKSATTSPRVMWQRWVRRFAPVRPGADELGHYPDGWIGPVYRVDLDVPQQATRFSVLLQHAPPERAHAKISSRLIVDGVVADRKRVDCPCQFSLVADVTRARGRHCQFEVLTSDYFVPRLLNGGADDRKLSVLLLEQRID